MLFNLYIKGTYKDNKDISTNKNFYKGSKEIRTLNRFIKSETLYLLSYTSNLNTFKLKMKY